MNQNPEDCLDEEDEDDPYEDVGLFYLMEHDAIHKILEDNGIDYEIEIYDGTEENKSRGSFGLNVQFNLYIHKDYLEKANILLEKYYPK